MSLTGPDDLLGLAETTLVRILDGEIEMPDPECPPMQEANRRREAFLNKQTTTQQYNMSVYNNAQQCFKLSYNKNKCR